MENFTLGFIFCVCVMGLTYQISGAKSADVSRSKLLAECEKSLPRGQTCVLIVIPKQETIQEK